ncbi:BlaI/MecI/CopY family transcriptional regulator [bacterium]|nr:BlaI/MecI/CopY family transcriptional regulator [bacterium]
MMKRKKLSSTEWSLMKICWEKGHATVREIYEETLKEKKRGYQTVKTMLDRMVKKGFQMRDKLGPIWLYKPAASRMKIMKEEIETLTDNVLDNTLVPLFAHLAEKEKLTREEIKALRDLIEKHKGEL